MDVPTNPDPSRGGYPRRMPRVLDVRTISSSAVEVGLLGLEGVGEEGHFHRHHRQFQAEGSPVLTTLKQHSIEDHYDNETKSPEIRPGASPRRINRELAERIEMMPWLSSSRKRIDVILSAL